MHRVGHRWGLASRSKPHAEYDHHLSQIEETGLYRYNGTLLPNPEKTRTAVSRQVCRDVRWCERCTVGLLLTLVYSIRLCYFIFSINLIDLSAKRLPIITYPSADICISSSISFPLLFIPSLRSSVLIQAKRELDSATFT